MVAMRFFVLTLVLAPAIAGAADQNSAKKPTLPAQRVPFDDRRVVGSPDGLSPFKVVRAFPNLTVKQPLAMFPEPGTDRLFILQHLNFWSGPGRILATKDDQNTSQTTQLVEIDGLAVGFAFHPNYEKNGYLYVGLNGPMKGDPKKTKVIRYTVSRKPPYGIDPATALTIIEWDSNGHNGGDLAFGNDGYLYVSSGDGSSDSDADLTGQTTNDLLACVVRIDVDHPAPGKNYGIPKDNPFLDRPGACPELWAYGLRNPWRLSYDKESGQLWVGQNGQDLWEQVYLIEKGQNYGWSVTEGSHIFHATRESGPDPIRLPAAEHHHSEARSLTGGRVYRGPSVPSLVGEYVYGDWSTGRVWGVRHDGEKAFGHRELVDTPFNITGFGIDHQNELYVIDQVTGGFYRLVPTTEADLPKLPFPGRLSETGLFTDVAAHTPHAAALPYEVRAPQWADNAKMERFASISGSERILQQPQKNAGGAWTLPNESVLTQTLTLDVVGEDGKTRPRRVETRVLVRQQGEWLGVSYRWNEDQTDAEIVPGAGDTEVFNIADPKEPGGVREQIWRFPARSECLVCHSRAAGFVLGFSPLQLDKDVAHGNKTVNQLRQLEALGLFEGELPRQGSDKPKLVDPYDATQPAEARVKSYLHVNCSTCHVKEGGGNALMQLDVETPLASMNLVNEVPRHDKFEIPDAKIVTPGAPEKSVLYQRISRRMTGQMPPLGTTEIDRTAVELVADWIKSLPKAKPAR